MAIEGSMLGLISYSVKELFDSVFVPQDRSSVWFVGILIFSIFSIRAIAGFLQRSLILKAGIEIVSKIQKDISAHIIDLDYEFFFKNSPGDLIFKFYGITIYAFMIAGGILLKGIGKGFIEKSVNPDNP